LINEQGSTPLQFTILIIPHGPPGLPERHLECYLCH
jgi:hypothetical protein